MNRALAHAQPHTHAMAILAQLRLWQQLCRAYHRVVAASCAQTCSMCAVAPLHAATSPPLPSAASATALASAASAERTWLAARGREYMATHACLGGRELFAHFAVVEGSISSSDLAPCSFTKQVTDRPWTRLNMPVPSSWSFWGCSSPCGFMLACRSLPPKPQHRPQFGLGLVGWPGARAYKHTGGQAPQRSATQPPTHQQRDAPMRP
jgi:hypothetical protein